MMDGCSRPNVLIVDDDPSVARFFERLLASKGYNVHLAHDGDAACTAVSSINPDVVLLDVMMPGMDGFEVCDRIKRDRATRLTPVVLVTSLDNNDARVKGLDCGADDFLTKPVNSNELVARVRSLIRMKRYTDDLDSATSIISTLAVMIEARDGNTEGHCHRMANYATALGRAIGLGDDDLQTLHRGGFLHDIGMLAIPDELLTRAGTLEPEEFERIKSHTIVGDNLCGNLRSLQAVRPIVRHHHERLDGSGYPDGLHGADIPVIAQIIGVVDVFDAITTKRPYQRAISAEQAADILRDQVRRKWRSGDLVEPFLGLVQGGRLGIFTGSGDGDTPPLLTD
jgi:putative two-component system response regulator